MEIPSDIKTAIKAASSERQVAEATRLRDAEVWAWAGVWNPESRFRRNPTTAMAERAMGPRVGARALRDHGRKAERYLLDMAHRVRYTPKVLRYVSAWHWVQRNIRDNIERYEG